MPTATDAQRTLMKKWFGSIGDDGPSRFLLARGWNERGGMWYKPVPSHTTSAYELECVKFLRDEWDHDWHASGDLFFTDVYKDAKINIMTGETSVA